MFFCFFRKFSETEPSKNQELITPLQCFFSEDVPNLKTQGFLSALALTTACQLFPLKPSRLWSKEIALVFLQQSNGCIS